jgi:hypothetical protein
MSIEISAQDRLLVHHVQKATALYKGAIQEKLPPERVANLDELNGTLQGWADGTEELFVVRHELVVAHPTIKRAQTIWAKPSGAIPLLVLEQDSRNIDEERIAEVLRSPTGPSEDELRRALPYPKLSQRPEMKLIVGLANPDQNGRRTRSDIARITFTWTGDKTHPIIRGHIPDDYRTFNDTGRRQVVPLTDLTQMRAAINTHAQRAAA